MSERIHYLKTQAEAWDAVEAGEKTFEVRKNDRCYQRGDTIVLQKLKLGDVMRFEFDGYGMSAKPKELRRRIGWMLQGGQFGIEPNYCVFTLEPLP